MTIYKKCPFCGEDMWIVDATSHYTGRNEYACYIECSSCTMQVGHGELERDDKRYHEFNTVDDAKAFIDKMPIVITQELIRELPRFNQSEDASQKHFSKTYDKLPDDYQRQWEGITLGWCDAIKVINKLFNITEESKKQ